MTHKIDIHNYTRTIRMSKWCQKNLNNNEWDLKLLSMNPLHYKFEFKDPKIHLMAVLAH
jgi:hypothetical protein